MNKDQYKAYFRQTILEAKIENEQGNMVDADVLFGDNGIFRPEDATTNERGEFPIVGRMLGVSAIRTAHDVPGIGRVHVQSVHHRIANPSAYGSTLPDSKVYIDIIAGGKIGESWVSGRIHSLSMNLSKGNAIVHSAQTSEDDIPRSVVDGLVRAHLDAPILNPKTKRIIPKSQIEDYHNHRMKTNKHKPNGEHGNTDYGRNDNNDLN